MQQGARQTKRAAVSFLLRIWKPYQSHAVDETRDVRLGLWGAATLDPQPVGSRGLLSGPCWVPPPGQVRWRATPGPLRCLWGPPPWAIHGEPHSGLCTESPAVGSSGVLGPPVTGSVALVSRFMAWVCKAWVGLWCPCLGPWGSEASHATWLSKFFTSPECHLFSLEP